MAQEFAEWLERVRDLSDEEFLDRSPPPCFLALSHPTSTGSDSMEQTVDSGLLAKQRDLPEELAETNVGSLRRCLVYPIRKRKGANLDSMITLGRGRNNDVVIDSNSVSKLHAVLFSRAGSWFVRDADSRNGTCVENRELEPEVTTRLEDWSRIRFARVLGLFVLPETMLKARALLRAKR